MVTRGKAGVTGALLIVGAIAGALSKWYLVWLAQWIGGPEGLGIYGMLFAVATPLFVAAQLGLRTILLSKSTAFPWRSYVLLRLAGLTIGSSVMVVFVLHNPAVSFSLGISVLCMKIVDSIVDLDLARIQYSGRIMTVAALSLAGAPLSLLFSTLGALATMSLSVAVGGAALGSLFVAGLARWLALKQPYVSESADSGVSEILRASLPVTIAQLLASFLIYLPILFLSFSSDLAVVGFFTGVSYVLTVSDLIGASFSKLLITPLRSIRKRKGDMAVIRRVNVLSWRLTLVGAVLGVFFLVIGSPFFQWIYGPEFELSLLVLSLLAVGAICVVLSHVQSVCLNVLNQYSRVAVSFTVACGLAFLVGILLTFFSVDSLVVGSAMAAAGAAGRTAMMVLGVAKASTSVGRHNVSRLFTI